MLASTFETSQPIHCAKQVKILSGWGRFIHMTFFLLLLYFEFAVLLCRCKIFINMYCCGYTSLVGYGTLC